MRFRLGQHLSYANVMATVAVFLALGGTTYAALNLPANSVGTKQLRKGAVTNAKLANGAVTGSKIQTGSVTGSQVNASTLGTVPNASTAQHANAADNATDAQHANTADNATDAQHASVADSLSSNGDFQALPLNTGWVDNVEPLGDDSVAVGYYKDREGFVHLRGSAVRQSGSSGLIGTLPSGFRPAGSLGAQAFEVTETIGGGTAVTVDVLPDGEIHDQSGLGGVVLDGVSFRAGN
jgi:hypothetical protein